MLKNNSHTIYILKLNTIGLLSTISNNLRMFIHGIKHGKSNSFFGRTYFYKRKQSSIVIGSNCVFRSYRHSNLIGINRNCSLSTLTSEAKISIGNNCGLSGTVIGCFTNIILEDGVMCGANTLITDSDWHSDDYRSGDPKPVHIGKNVWLGEGVKVLKGVSIGENTVVGAGSVVVKNLPENAIAGGNPCKVIKMLGE